MKTVINWYIQWLNHQKELRKAIPYLLENNERVVSIIPVFMGAYIEYGYSFYHQHLNMKSVTRGSKLISKKEVLIIYRLTLLNDQEGVEKVLFPEKSGKKGVDENDGIRRANHTAR